VLSVAFTGRSSQLCRFVLVSSLVHAAEASAQAQPSARLDYARGQGTTECPEEAELQSIVAARLGYDPFSVDGESTLRVTITRTGRGLRGQIRLENPSRGNLGARAIESTGADCTELAKAMALAISIAVEPLRALEAAPSGAHAPTPAPSHADASAPTAADTETSPNRSSATQGSADAATRQPRSGGSVVRNQDASGRPGASGTPEPLPTHAEQEGASMETSRVRAPTATGAGHEPWQVSLAAFGSAGWSPGIAPGAALGVGWVGNHVSLELEGRADLPRTTGWGRGSITVSPLLFTLAGCGRLDKWGLCALGRAGRLHGSGEGYAVDAGGASLLLGLGARVMWEGILMGPFHFRAFVDLDGILTRNNFDVDHQPAWAVSTVAVTLGFAALVRFH